MGRTYTRYGKDSLDFNRRGPRKSPKKYTQPTQADYLYADYLSKGFDKKTAAKQAQEATGLSLITGQRMKSKGFGQWPNLDKLPQTSL